MGEKLLAAGRDGWITAWYGTLKLRRYLSPGQCCSCVLNSAELFHGDCLWGRLSMEGVPGF